MVLPEGYDQMRTWNEQSKVTASAYPDMSDILNAYNNHTSDRGLVPLEVNQEQNSEKQEVQPYQFDNKSKYGQFKKPKVQSGCCQCCSWKMVCCFFCLFLLLGAAAGGYVFYVEVIVDCWKPNYILQVNPIWGVDRSTANQKAWYENFGWDWNTDYQKDVSGVFCKDGYSCFFG